MFDMIKKLIVLSFFLLFFIPAVSYGQNKKIDSLRKFIQISKEDTSMVNALNSIGKEFEFINQDTSGNYIDKAIKLAISLDYKNGLGISYTYKGYLAEDQSQFDSAITFYSKAYALFLKTGDKDRQAHQLKLIGEATRYKGNLMSALDYYQKSLSLYDQIGSKSGVADANYSMGGIFQDMKQYDKAMKHYKRALDINRELNSPIDLANAITAVGVAYNFLGDYAMAKKHYAEAKKIYDELGYDNGLSNCLTWMAITAYNEKNIPQSLEYFMASIKLYEKINSISGLMYAYNNIGSIYTEQGNFAKAIEWEKKSLEMALKSEGLEYIKYSYETLSNTYAKMGDYKNAFENHRLYMKYADSLLNETTTKQLAELDKKYESAQKDKELIIKDAEIVKQAAETEKQTTQRNYFILGFAIMLILVVFVFRGYRQKQKANEIIALQKHEVELQKNLIEEKQKEIVDSISYAKRLQQAILPPLNLVRQYFESSFILFKPKDIVAGDFYWMEVIGETKYIAAADCTGHGVPGAMVSVVCSNALNRTVKEFGIKEPGEILNKVRELVVETFQKSENEVKDGMDISLCAFNANNHELYWAGANNPLWIIRNGSTIELKPNKQPIGKTDNPEPFSTHHISLLKEDMIYLFSDGFADQFGGEKGKKFKYKPLKELLEKIHSLPAMEQYSILEKTITDWKGPLEQVDDILLVGIKV